RADTALFVPFTFYLNPCPYPPVCAVASYFLMSSSKLCICTTFVSNCLAASSYSAGSGHIAVFLCSAPPAVLGTLVLAL
ncbi:hypothetical protein EVAR_38022_1, partial [Eumeta japonica]